ncbi:hypothetical protein T492DRAFT_30582 [Pavlovales sp. CCMP2436]|nr:hypothetical protein T492DRAFT_30582 [Pavlovales sp. CCMP2436]
MAPKFKEPKARSDVVRSWRSVEPVVVAEAPAAATPEGALAVEGEGVAAGVGEGAVEPPPAAAEEVVHQEGEAVHQEGEGEAHDGRFDDAEAEGVHQEAAPAVEGEAQEAKAGSAPPPGVLTTQFRLADASDGSRLTVGDEVTFTLINIIKTNLTIGATAAYGQIGSEGGSAHSLRRSGRLHPGGLR